MNKCVDPIDEGRACPPLDLRTPSAVLKAGLDLVYTEKKTHKVKGDPLTSHTNIQRFKDHCGANPAVVSQIWEDLQTTTVPEARIKVLDFSYFLEALNFLCRCHRESEREAQFDKSPKTLRKWSRCCLMKAQALKAKKIAFPTAEEFGDDVLIMSVDGTHSLFHEIAHPEFSQNRTCFSHKKKHAGLCYELGIYESKLIWMNGSFPAGPNDKANFTREGGLRDKLAAMGKKAVGDKGCTGCPNECSTFNAFDHAAVKAFKSRAQMRHEQFNGMLKEHSSLADQFRHEQEWFDVAFEAACVICQHRMEHGEPLFDLMAGIRI